METTYFGDILQEAANEVTALDPDNLDTNEFRAIRRAANSRLQHAWNYHFWPDLMKLERRYFRPDVTGNENAGDIAYYPPLQKYFQALVSTPGVLPDDPNALSCWTEAETSYQADTFSGTAAYVQGDQVQYGDDFYQLFAASATGVLPTDATQWGKLVPFDKYIPYERDGFTSIGVVTAAWSANPRTTTRGNELNWSLSENGVQILTPINYAWLEYRTRCPVLFGDLYDASFDGYDAGWQIYFRDDQANIRGEFHDVLGPVNPGQNPENAPSLFSRILLPRIFHNYLVNGLAADWMRGPGGAAAQDVDEQEALAEAALEEQKSLLVGQQSQRVKTVVRTR
jgi:hypothetical protein